MKTPVLLGVVGEAVDFEPVFAAASERKVRLGWLQLDPAGTPPSPWAATPFTGVFRAVVVGDLATIAVKPRKGPAVLRDLLREHFLGADAVLVSGSDLYPKLARDGEGWSLRESAATAGRRLTLDQLFARLRKPELRWSGTESKSSSG